MQAIILCGGLGSRLDPLTKYIPKPLIEVSTDTPILKWQIGQLYAAGVRDIIFSTGYLHKSVESFIKTFNIDGLTVTCREDGNRLLGTAGAIKNCADLITSDNFIVTNGDIVSTIDVEKIMVSHSENALPISMALYPVEDCRDFGTVDFNENCHATMFREKGELTGRRYINAGIYVINKSVLDSIPKGKSMLETDVFPAYASANNINCYLSPEKSFWIDTGTWERFLFTRKSMLLAEGMKELDR